jgi:hypothetical protein
MIVGSLLGLAEAMLALDLGVVETVFEGETHDLGTLGLGSPVGDQGQPCVRNVRLGVREPEQGSWAGRSLSRGNAVTVPSRRFVSMRRAAI